MRLPILPPYPPMEAKAVARIPAGDQWLYEPKWDGGAIGCDGEVAKLANEPYHSGDRNAMQKIKRLRTGEWEPVKPTLVCEVRYDHFSGGRFRQPTKLLRWRPDKKPRQCTFEQLS